MNRMTGKKKKGKEWDGNTTKTFGRSPGNDNSRKREAGDLTVRELGRVPGKSPFREKGDWTTPAESAQKGRALGVSKEKKGEKDSARKAYTEAGEKKPRNQGQCGSQPGSCQRGGGLEKSRRKKRNTEERRTSPNR